MIMVITWGRQGLTEETETNEHVGRGRECAAEVEREEYHVRYV